jgi:hypothetical protein
LLGQKKLLGVKIYNSKMKMLTNTPFGDLAFLHTVQTRHEAYRLCSECRKPKLGCGNTSTLPQLLFVYGTRTEQVRRAHDLFNQGRWEDLWKLALKAGERAKARAAKNPRQSKAKSEPQKDKYAQKCARAGNLSNAAKTLYQESLPAVTADNVDKLRLLHPEGELEYNKEFRPSLQQEVGFWESEEGRNLLLDAFSLCDTRAYIRRRPALGAPDPDGWRGQEHASHFFLNDDAEAQQRIIKHLMAPYAKGDFHQEYVHEHTGGRLSAFFKKDLIKIRPINNSSLCRRAAAHLINAFIKKDANKYFTETFPNFIQTAGSVDGATVCAKLLSMIHDLPLVSEDPTIICQIDFANAFQTPNRQFGTDDCILCRVSREYDEGRVKVGDLLPHFPSLKKFFPYFSSMNDVPSRNRFTDHEGSTHHIAGSRGGLQGDPLEMTRFCLTVHPIWGCVLGRHQATLGDAYADDDTSWAA